MSSTPVHRDGIAPASQTAATIRIAASDIYNNLAGFGCGSGTLASAGNNEREAHRWWRQRLRAQRDDHGQ